MADEVYLYYGGGTSFTSNGIGLSNTTLITNDWVGMTDFGAEFLPWPAPGTDVSGEYFRSRQEQKDVELIISNPEVKGRKLQDVMRNWVRGPNLSFLKRHNLKVDFMLVTHLHYDHAGAPHYAEPFLSPHARIHGLPHTLAAMPLTLKDSSNLSPYFLDKREIAPCLNRRSALAQGFNRITPQGVWVGLSGHTFGALNAGFRLPNGKVAGITGDIAWHWQPMASESLLPDDLPDEWLYDSLIVTDFTYPHVRKTSFDADLMEVLAIAEHCVKNKEVGIFSTYSTKGVGLASEFSRRGIPVYIDGMIRKLWDIYSMHHHSTPQYPALHTKNVRKIWSARHREEVIAYLEKNGGVVVTTSASGEGPSRRYQGAGLNNERYRFVYVGWVPEDSIMNQIQLALQGSLQPTIQWSGNPGETRFMNLRAKVEQRSASSHADMSDWRRFLETLIERRKKAKKGRLLDSIFVVHCPDSLKPQVKEELRPYAERIELVTKEKRLFRLY